MKQESPGFSRGECQLFILVFLPLVLFVTFFPQLIAGPIMHHAELIPQFKAPGAFKPQWEHLAVGFTVFVFGLFKKVVLADSLSPYADGPFNAAAQGASSSLLEAWGRLDLRHLRRAAWRLHGDQPRLAAALIVFCMPNVHQIMGRFAPALAPGEPATEVRAWHWQPNLRWALVTGLIAAVAFSGLSRVTAFLYFQF